MAQELDLQTKITIQSKAAQKQLRSFVSAVNGVEKSLKTAGQRVDSFGKKLSGIGRNFSLFITAPLVGFSGLAVKAAGDIESIEIALAGLTGSAENAEKTMRSLIDFTAKTPFQLQDVANTARTLLSFGVAADEVQGTLQTLGNIAAGSGSSIRELGTIYGQVLAAGRLTGERFLQFAERGIPLGKELANVLGIQESELRDMISAGQVGLPAVQQALANLTSEGGQFAGQLEAQSKSINGTLSTLKDNINLLFADIGRSISDSFDLPGLFNQISSFIQGIRDAFTNLSDETKRLIFIIGGIVAGVGPVLIGLGGFISVLGLATAGIGSFVAALGTIVTAMAPVIAAIAPFAGVAAAIVGVGVAIAGLINLFNQLRTVGKSTFESLQLVATLAAKAIANAFTFVFRKQLSLFGSLLKRVSEFSAFFGQDTLSSNLRLWGDGFQDLSDSLKFNLGATIKEIDEDLKQIGSSTANAMSLGLTNKISEALDNIRNKFKQTNAEMRAGSKETTNAFSNDAKETEKQYTGLANNVANNFTSAFGQIAEGTKSTADAFKDSMKNIANYIRDAIIQALILRALSSALPGVFQTTSGQGAGALGVAGFASGGKINGKGTGTSDSNLIAASDGEYMIKASSVKSMGTRMLDHINNFGRIPKFANGGMVGDGSLAVAGGGINNGGMRVVVENSGSPKEASSATISQDAQGTVLNIILDDISRNGRVSRSMQSTYGLKRGGI